MKSQVRIAIRRDGTSECELTARFYSGDFAGKGSAWFNIADVDKFIRELSIFPIRPGALLRGGFWHSRDNSLEQEHLFLATYPIGVAGSIGFRVRASTPVHIDDRIEHKHSAEVELLTEYEALRRFSASLANTLRGTQTEAILEADL